MTATLGGGLPQPARKELYSIAYLTAVAAAAQCEVLIPKMDYDSLDAFIYSTKGKRPIVSAQLKATSQDCVANGHLSFDLTIKNYDDLRTEARAVPIMLVVQHLPEVEGDWITHDVDILSLKKSAYYCNLLGRPPTANAASIRINIPTSQRLTKESLEMLLQHVSDHRMLP